TAFGLAAAIPAVIGYNHFLHRLQLATTELEGFTASLLNAAEEQEADPGTAPQIPATRGIG
ncbi:MAG: Tol-Pal system subunit TolQ, partial [Acidobacteriota bacterium]